MKTNTKSQRSVEHGKPRFAKLIFNSASALGLALVALGLLVPSAKAATAVSAADQEFMQAAAQGGMTEVKLGELDRKSTRLNSSHLVISYAVFCLKKTYI